MRGRAAIAFAVLVAAPAGAVPYLQAGVDSGNTGWTPDPGPPATDLALRVDFPGPGLAPSFPLIQWPYVWWASLVFGADIGEASTFALHQVDVRSGEYQQLAAYDQQDASYFDCFASDGQRIFTAPWHRLYGFDLETQKDAWAPQLLSTELGEVICRVLRVHDGRLFLGGSDGVFGADIAPQTDEVDGLLLAPGGTTLFAFDIESGERLARLTWRDLVVEQVIPDPSYFVASIAAGDEGVVVLLTPGILPDGQLAGLPVLVYLDHGLNVLGSVRLPTDSLADPDYDRALSWQRGDVALRDGRVIVNLDSVLWYEFGASEWLRNVPIERVDSKQAGNGLVVGPLGTVAANGGAVHLITAGNRPIASEPKLTSSGDWSGFLTVTGSRIYHGEQAASVADSAMTIRDMADLRLIASYGLDDLQAAPTNLVVGDGLAAATSREGTLLVFGHLPGSPTVHWKQSLPYPQAGQTIRFDVNATSGALGGRPSFEINWGDDNTRFLDGPGTIEHAYATNGIYQGTVIAHFDSGARRTMPFSVTVGALPPVPETALSKAFNPDNEEKTFFVLGIVFALLLSAFGAWRLWRRRGRLAMTLTAIDGMVKDQSGEPILLSTNLAKERARIQQMLVDGKIDEAQFQVLDGALDRHARGVRRKMLAADLGFLPFSMVAKLEQLLEDGRITSWERRSFLEVLAEDQGLTKAQKSKVAGRIESWFAEDA